MASIGRKLRTKRLERDITQAQLADAMVEEGTTEPGDELLTRMNRWLASGQSTGKAKRGPYKRGS